MLFVLIVLILTCVSMLYNKYKTFFILQIPEIIAVAYCRKKKEVNGQPFWMCSHWHPNAKGQQTKERALALWIGYMGLPAQTVEDKDFIKMMEVVNQGLAIPKKIKICNQRTEL